ncbi:hypothetical protein DPMN_165404 [Dreissena polymorpha]|uniref:Uncharacterized protein n=1 Tax=Dreissena polymorpha TaxID=45954 RepID=A0A9D4EWT2_DREPO|nr:hypothetical protein DPMN_165404 [Dreissena polymorpha]
MARQRQTRAPGLVMGPCIVEIDLNRCRNKEVNFLVSSANSVGGDSGQDGQTAEITFQGSSDNRDGRTDGGDNHIIPFFSLKSNKMCLPTFMTSEHTGSHIFQQTRTIFIHIQNIIQTTILTKKNAPPLGGLVFQATGAVFEIVQDII